MQVTIITNEFKRNHRYHIKPEIKLQVVLSYSLQVAYFSAGSVIQIAFEEAQEEVNYVNDSDCKFDYRMYSVDLCVHCLF